MKLDTYKNTRWIAMFLLGGAFFLMFIDAGNGWVIVLSITAFLIGAHAIDKRQKEYLNERIDELKRRIEKIESNESKKY